MAQGYCILATMTMRHDRVRSQPALPAAQHRGRVWEHSKGSHLDRLSQAAARAGCREHFVDAALYDFEYRRRRADIHFYRQLARNRMEFAEGGAILDLACGSGRLLLPLLRDGHEVVGLDRSPQMLAAARRRLRRLSASRQQRCTLLRADMRDFAFRRKAALAVSAFHSVQHIHTNEDFLRFLRCTRATLTRKGWLAFDVLPPAPSWLLRDPDKRWGRTSFHHPSTGQRFVYSSNHHYDNVTRLLHMRLYYQPVDEKGQAAGKEHVVRLCHRQFFPDEVASLLAQSDFRLIETFGGFDGRPLHHEMESALECVYVAVAV
jgi:SAM-dependent methyltransferase